MAPKKAQNLVAKLRRKRFNKDAARQYLQEHGYKKARISQLLKNYEDLDAQSVSDGDSSLSAMSDKSIPKKEASDDNHEERKQKKKKAKTAAESKGKAKEPDDSSGFDADDEADSPKTKNSQTQASSSKTSANEDGKEK